MTEEITQATRDAYAVLEYGGWEPPKRSSRIPEVPFVRVPEAARNCNSGVVYVVKCGKFVKIGRARDLKFRMDMLQSVNPYPLKLLASLPGDHLLETALHRRFAALRHWGEWFKYSRRISAWVEGGCSLRFVATSAPVRKSKMRTKKAK